MGNVKVSTLQLSSLLGRSRFRSGRFGGGRAAGELVLDCQSCPVYHLDGLIVLQSQLSSLENCVDLHSKKPQMQLYLWSIENQTSGGNGPACISHYCSPPSSYMCANGHHSPVCTNVTRRVSTSRDFWKRINHSPWAPGSIFFLFKPAKNSLTHFPLTFSPSTSVIRAVTTFMLRSSPLCLSNNLYRLMKTEHFTLKDFYSQDSACQIWEV